MKSLLTFETFWDIFLEYRALRRDDFFFETLKKHDIFSQETSSSFQSQHSFQVKESALCHFLFFADRLCFLFFEPLG